MNTFLFIENMKIIFNVVDMWDLTNGETPLSDWDDDFNEIIPHYYLLNQLGMKLR